MDVKNGSNELSLFTFQKTYFSNFSLLLTFIFVCLFSREVKVRRNNIYSYLLYLFSLFPIGYPEAANEDVL